MNINADSSELQVLRDSMNKLSIDISDMTTDSKREIQRLQDEIQEKINRLRFELNELEAELAQVEDIIRSYESDTDENGNPCVAPSCYYQEAAQLEKEIYELREKINRIQEIANEFADDIRIPLNRIETATQNCHSKISSGSQFLASYIVLLTKIQQQRRSQGQGNASIHTTNYNIKGTPVSSGYKGTTTAGMTNHHINVTGSMPVMQQGANANMGTTNQHTENQSEATPTMIPVRSTPRDLAVTQYGFNKQDNGTLIYDSPMEMDKYLYSSQGSAYPDQFRGTCGLCSCANVLRLAGVNYDEKDMIDYAAHTSSGAFGIQKLCTVNPFDADASGGTNPYSRQKILEHFGISSGVFPIEMKNGVASDAAIASIAKNVSEGRGVIISVHSGELYYGQSFRDDYHAVTVTSVTKNKYGDIIGFHICDSNEGTRYYEVDKIKYALTGAAMNVTYSYIR